MNMKRVLILFVLLCVFVLSSCGSDEIIFTYGSTTFTPHTAFLYSGGNGDSADGWGSEGELNMREPEVFPLVKREGELTIELPLGDYEIGRVKVYEETDEGFVVCEGVKTLSALEELPSGVWYVAILISHRYYTCIGRRYSGYEYMFRLEVE